MYSCPGAQCAKPLLVGHSACWADELLPAWVQIQVTKEIFHLDYARGHAMRLNSRTVIGRLPNDWGKVWSVWGCQVKLCDPLVTHGPCLTSVVAVLCDSLLCG